MPTVKAEPPDPPARENQKSKKARIAAEPGILDRNLTADEKEALVKKFCDLSREPADVARKCLTMCAYDVPKAMYTWAQRLNAIDISSDVDDMATENEQPNGQSSSSSDVVNTMNRSSYGRIIRTVRRIPTLSQVTLPTIVVVGSESAGKSSTLERIAGLSLFPRDAKICTRMPIKLSLINADGGSKSRVTLKFPGRPDRVVTEANAASAVGQLMKEVVPPGRGVIDEVLTIEVRKPSVPTLDLVDLPGIVAASIEGEPADMMSRTRAISERYLRDSNTIVVAVVPANITRVRDSQAMQLVQAAGKEAMTLGVLAKADLAHDPRYKQRKQLSPYWELQQRLAGKSDDVVQLPNGWVAVKNRDTLVEEEESSGLQQSSEAERDWFAKEAKLGSEHCGINALLTKIDTLFTNHIKQTWMPNSVRHLEQQASEVAAQIDALGRSPSSLTLDELLKEFVKAFSSASVEQVIERGVFITVQEYVKKIVAEENVAAFPDNYYVTLRGALAKKKLEDKLVEKLPKLISCIAHMMTEAVKASFKPGLSPLRLERFEILRDAICEACTVLLKGSSEQFVKTATEIIGLFFMEAIGKRYPGRLHGGVCGPNDVQFEDGRLPRSIAEVALIELIGPIVSEPTTIGKVLQGGAATDKSAGGEQRDGGRKRKAAAEDDGERVDMSHLLIESCAAQRTELVKRKHDLYLALEEIRKL